MLAVKTWLFVALIAVTIFYLMTWFPAIRNRKGNEAFAPTPLQIGIEFIANFFNTPGIGSFATTTSMYKFWHQVRDEALPGTLNVGHTLPTITQAFIYMAIVEVDILTLILLIRSFGGQKKICTFVTKTSL